MMQQIMSGEYIKKVQAKEQGNLNVNVEGISQKKM